jgi:cation transport ATPase
MSIFGKILSGGGIKDLVGEVGNVIDNMTTTEEERLEAKQKIEKAVFDFEAQMQKEVTARWLSDNQGSWLTKNIRPLTLIFLCVSTVLLIFIDAGVITFEVKASWVDLLQLVLITVIGAYFGGRSFEKMKK